QSIEDRRRGIYSYEALRSRLTQGRFAQDGLVDMLAPVIRLQPLTHEELLVLIEKLADIHAGLFGYERTLTQEDLVRFMQVEYGRVGADTHLTPREVIRDFVEMLDILSQNPSLTIDDLLSSDELNAPVQSAVEEREASGRSQRGVTVPAAPTERNDDFTEFSI
ncbi:MAG: BREX system ATP-binding domain-containing protein, partial [Parafannyhessea sp.]|uniref:BREX system ATP-binding domain-containing protein n=1 Tax=Parafannyhessea sp. TaxID=2847324 RepID=UPI003F0E900F